MLPVAIAMPILLTLARGHDGQRSRRGRDPGRALVVVVGLVFVCLILVSLVLVCVVHFGLVLVDIRRVGILVFVVDILFVVVRFLLDLDIGAGRDRGSGRIGRRARSGGR